MESMVDLFGGAFEGKRVFLTGHTGFKGSWLAYWLNKLGADIMGYSIDIPSIPSHFEILHPDVRTVMGDIRNASQLQQAVADFRPEIIFHLAAQPLVRYSYQHPLETFDTNVMGTANVFEAARNCSDVRAIVNITSDKCYENLETDIAYKETDRMGGYDPYSASKGAAELIVNSYRNSFFNLHDYGNRHQVLLASARAGNVIGGGDWADDRLIPDIVKASQANQPVTIRNPKATRPWQHVLEPLSGYLLLGQLLLERDTSAADGWNFGPQNNETLPVEGVLALMKEVWPDLDYKIEHVEGARHEASLLRLDCSKANNTLNWYPIWDMDTAIQKTAAWYQLYYGQNKIATGDQLDDYVNTAREEKQVWTTNKK